MNNLSDLPPGTSNFDIEAAQSDDDDLIFPCEVSEGEDRCPNEATRIAREPYTPKAFKVRCCAECADSLFRFGYSPDLEADKELAKEKAEYEAREYADMMDAQMSEAERLGER